MNVVTRLREYAGRYRKDEARPPRPAAGRKFSSRKIGAMKGKVMQQLIEIFEKANRNFLNEEKNLILSGVSERTLCGTLMLYLNKEIRGSIFHKYHVDVEYNRNDGKIKTIINNAEEIININCDLIVHSRGEIIEQDNLIALENEEIFCKKK
jgi:hypothetical protein